MYRMLKEALKKENYQWSREKQAILPIMTALFVDGLGPGQSGHPHIAEWYKNAFPVNNIARIFRLPLPVDIPSNKSSEMISSQIRELDQRGKINTLSIESSEQVTAVRPLIRGISHHFNNLLMGIWGNATLIRMQINEGKPLYVRMCQMERLIHSGAFLIHTVLGYLGERRSLAKKIRLNQLVGQIKEEIFWSEDKDNPWNFEARLKWASRIQRPRMIAGSTARVLEVLFQGIQSHCKDISSIKTDDVDIQKKLEMIRRLVMRGLDLTYRLRLYAEDFKPDPSRIRLAPLMRRVINQQYDLPPTIKIDFDPAEKLPLVRGERHKLEWVLEQLIANAVTAMPRGGRIDITIRTLEQETVEDRCAVQKGSDYIVITIKDTGKGIPFKAQKRIFEPFFAYPKKKTRNGLGLAAADGVLKSHNGYIQVQSKLREGSKFKLYLPIAGAAAQGQALKSESCRAVAFG
jgi:signal transduction histidine kinase